MEKYKISHPIESQQTTPIIPKKLSVFRLLVAIFVTGGFGFMLFLASIFATDSGTSEAMTAGNITLLVAVVYVLLSLFGIYFAHKKQSLLMLNIVIYIPIILYTSVFVILYLF